MGVPTLRAVFDEQYYTSLPGGILEGLGRLFQGNVRLYVYPTRDRAGGRWRPPPRWKSIPNCNTCWTTCGRGAGSRPSRISIRSQLHMFPDEVLAAIQNGTPGWEQYLPAASGGSHQTTGIVWISPSWRPATARRSSRGESAPDYRAAPKGEAVSLDAGCKAGRALCRDRRCSCPKATPRKVKHPGHR